MIFGTLLLNNLNFIQKKFQPLILKGNRDMKFQKCECFDDDDDDDDDDDGTF